MENFETIGNWLEDTFGKNEDIEDRYANCHLWRVLDEIEEMCELAPVTEGVAHEAADVVIALAGMCRRYGIDLQAAVDEKMKINREREWEVYSNGTGRHITSNKNWSMLDE